MEFICDSIIEVEEFASPSKVCESAVCEAQPLVIGTLFNIWVSRGNRINNSGYELNKIELSTFEDISMILSTSESFSHCYNLIFSLNSKSELSLCKNNKSRLEDLLLQLQELKFGWDGQNALKPSADAVRHARLFISYTKDYLLRKASFFPSNDAGLYLRGILNNVKYTVFFDGIKFTYVIKSNQELKSESLVFNENNVRLLNSLLCDYGEKV